MSDQIVRSVNETSGSGSQLMQSYQSVWMSHWKRTSCNKTTQACNGSSSAVGSTELDCSAGGYNSPNGLKVLRSVKGYGEIETKNEGLRNEGLEFQDFPMAGPANGGSSSLSKHGQDTNDLQALRPVSGHNSDRGKAVDSEPGIQLPSVFPGISAANELSSRGCHYLDEGTSNNSPEWMRPHSSAKDSTFAASKPLKETFVKLSSHAVPYTSECENFEFDKGKISAPSLIRKSAIISSNHLSDANLRILEHEYHHNHGQSVDLGCDGNMDGHSQPENSVNACFRESHTSLLFNAPSTSNHHLPALGREWFHKLQKCSGSKLFPSQFVASGKTEFTKSLYDCYSLQKVPKCVCDVETMRICTTVDSVGEPGGYPRFSQTTHSLLFTKMTDVNLSKENDILSGTRVLGNTPSDLHIPSPFHCQGKQGLKLHSLSSSTDSEGKGNFEYVKTSEVTMKNESLTETDTMDINSFKENNPQPGAFSSPSNKTINMNWNLPSPIAVASSKQAGRRWANIKLPDINMDIPALPAAVTSSENAGPISPRTQSLEMDILLAHAEQPTPKSNLFLDGSPMADPSNRWLKRLKLSSSHSYAQGTKCSNMAEYTPHDKLNKVFRRILNSSITSSEPAAMKPCGKESMVSDQRRYLSKEDQGFSMNPTKTDKELLLSHAWIQRWLRNEPCITQKKSETVMFCESQKSKLALENLQKEHFPNIAAMALMGKAMSVFQPCEFQKRGSFTVWNTKAS